MTNIRSSNKKYSVHKNLGQDVNKKTTETLEISIGRGITQPSLRGSLKDLKMTSVNQYGVS